MHFNVFSPTPCCFVGKPTIDLETHDIVVIEGEKLSIPVPFRAVPVPTVSWHKDGKEVKASDRLTMKSDHISAHLEVPKSVHADAGVYTITLENKLGSATASINVKVIGNNSVMKYRHSASVPGVIIASYATVCTNSFKNWHLDPEHSLELLIFI